MSVCPSCSRELQAGSCPVCERVTDARPPELPPIRRRWRKLVFATAGVLFIGLLSYWFAQAIRTARLAVERSSCNCNLKLIGLALYNYHDAYGSFPPAYIADAEGRPMHSWRVLILPFVDCNDLYKEYNLAEPWDSPANLALLDKRPGVFDCVSRDESSVPATPVVAATGLLACSGGRIRPGITTAYAAVMGANSVFRGSEPVSVSEITDGPSNTLIIGELSGAQIPWTKPEDIDISRHPQIGDAMGFSNGLEASYGVYFLVADGSVRRLELKTPQKTVDALFTRNGDEQIGDF